MRDRDAGGETRQILLPDAAVRERRIVEGGQRLRPGSYHDRGAQLHGRVLNPLFRRAPAEVYAARGDRGDQAAEEGPYRQAEAYNVVLALAQEIDLIRPVRRVHVELRERRQRHADSRARVLQNDQREALDGRRGGRHVQPARRVAAVADDSREIELPVGGQLGWVDRAARRGVNQEYERRVAVVVVDVARSCAVVARRAAHENVASPALSPAVIAGGCAAITPAGVSFTFPALIQSANTSSSFGDGAFICKSFQAGVGESGIARHTLAPTVTCESPEAFALSRAQSGLSCGVVVVPR